ncbi:MAG TPA: 6-carboxytetrahydropterin synthase [Candidatus Alistipes merdigallinarum]|nr:6-carboxytetrahydropterin synthase [Candidatus Alistipes merdigallinarum]
MSVVRLTKEFSFEMAHSLSGYDGACREIHGHSYKLFVTVQGKPNDDPSDPKYGMVMDFGELKRIVGRLIVDRYDHALVIRRTTENGDAIDALRSLYHKIEICDYQPTCENMVSRFAEEIRRELPQGIELFSIKLHETATSFAEWYRSDN